MRQRGHKIIFSLWIFFITLLSIIPSPDGMQRISDSYVHFAVYFVTTFLCFLSFRDKKISALILAGCISFIYGVFIECVQFTLPYRNFSTTDIAANTYGILAFIVMAITYLHFLRPREIKSLYKK
jgi:VanZ family protein